MEQSAFLYLNYLLGYAQDRMHQQTCTEEEVDEIERSLHLKFPRAYRELYLLLGKRRAFNITEHTFNYPDYQKMRDAAIKMIGEEDIGVNFDDSIFVFSCDLETTTICYFRLDEGDDPPVYQYSFDTDEPERMADHFSAYIKMMPWYEGYLWMKEQESKNS